MTIEHRGGPTSWHPRELEEAATYRAYLFGTPHVHLAGHRLYAGDLPRRKAWEVLTWFLLNPGRPCSAETLTETLWPEEEPSGTIGSFHVSLHALRRCLEPGLGRREESRFIRRHSSKIYSFEAGDEWWTDVADLERLHILGEASERADDLPRARFFYRRVAGYVAQGPLLDGEDHPWLESYRRRLGQICQQSLSRLMQLDAEVGNEDELIESAYLTLKIDPYNQHATKIIIESCLRDGLHHAAERRLFTFCDWVRRDLDMPIPGEFVELRRRVGSPVADDVARPHSRAVKHHQHPRSPALQRRAG